MSGVQEARVVENTLVVSDNDSKIASMIREFELNANGVIVRLSNVGASITSIRMPNFSLNKDDGDAVDEGDNGKTHGHNSDECNNIE